MTTGEMPVDYFKALSETPEEGEALYNLHRSRAAWERRQSEQPSPAVDGGP